MSYYSHQRPVVFRFFRLFIVLALISTAATGYAQSGVSPTAAEQAKIEESVKLYEKYKNDGNQSLAAKYLNQTAYAYWQANDSRAAIKYFEESLKLNEAVQNNNAIRTISMNLGMIYSDVKDWAKSIMNFEKALAISREFKDKRQIASSLNNIAGVYSLQNKPQEANDRLQEAFGLAQELEDVSLMVSVCGGLADNYKKLGNSAKHLEYYNLYATFNQYKQVKKTEKAEKMAMREREARKRKELELQLQEALYFKTKDSLDKAELIAQKQEMEAQLLRKEKDLQEAKLTQEQALRQQKEAELKKTRVVMFMVILGIVVVMVFLVLLRKQIKEKQQANTSLAEKNVVLVRQKQLIEEKNGVLVLQKQEIEEKNGELGKKNKQITDSIMYASKIQEAILPSKKAIQDNFPDSFIFYRPRDIVSGDFYWFGRHDNMLFISAVDCTGHSVPGAFMSMIGNTLLNEIINEKRIYDPSSILESLNSGIVSALKQEEEGGSQEDGMDITFCRFDMDSKELTIAAANHLVIVITDGELVEVEGDIFSIGGAFSMLRQVEFQNQSLPLGKETCVYMFSDGFQDQFGGPDGKKFMLSRLKTMLLNIYQLPMSEQLVRVEEAFYDWKREERQIDDVLLIGIKVMA